MKQISRLLFVLFAFTCLVAPSMGTAGAIIDFGIVAPTAGGSISYAGGVAPLIGSNIQVDNHTGLGTPLNDGITTSLSGYYLNFTTGNLASSTATSWNFGPGGTISIGNGSITLLSGHFSNLDVTKQSGDFKIAGASFFDTKNLDLLTLYGLQQYANNLFDGNFNLSFSASGSPPGSFTSTLLLSGDVTNTVPEPGTMMLLGSGLVGLAGWGRKKFRK